MVHAKNEAPATKLTLLLLTLISHSFYSPLFMPESLHNSNITK